MTRIVSFPMYPAPATVFSSFWSGLRHHMAAAGLHDIPDEPVHVPADLLGHWRNADLLLSQTCGYPLTSDLVGQVQLVGTPVYAAQGCDGPFYSSVVVVRDSDLVEGVPDLRGRRAAFNERGSQSGWNALRALVAPLAENGRFFGSTVTSGAHRQSLLLVQTGAADVATIDCVTFALHQRHAPETVRGLRVLTYTPSGVPGLPLITSIRTSQADLDRLRLAFAAACADAKLAECREALLLTGFELLPLDAYAACRVMEDEAHALGYPELV